MVLDTIAFALLSAVLLGSSLAAVLVRDVWHAALLLGVSLVTAAALYVTLAAEFLAAIQVLVYVGGVLVLITFAVMLTRREIQEETGDSKVPTGRPELQLGPHLLTGVVAIGLFAVMAWIFATAGFGEPAGFPADASVIDSIGFALIDVVEGGVEADALPPDTVPSEGFLVALIVIALVLDAALDGAIHLARREEEGDVVTALGGEDD